MEFSAFISASKGDIASLKNLISEGFDINTINHSGENILFRAAKNGHLDYIKFAIDNGAHANVLNNDKSSPLFIAVENSQIEVIRLLSEYCDVNKVNDFRISVIMEAMFTGNTQVIDALVGFCFDNETCLYVLNEIRDSFPGHMIGYLEKKILDREITENDNETNFGL